MFEPLVKLKRLSKGSFGFRKRSLVAKEGGHLKVSFAALSVQDGYKPPPLKGKSLVAPDRTLSYISIDTAGIVTAFNGHVDLGTGVKTAFAQIVAEELDVALSQVRMVLGDTDRTPDQGPTTASASIQSSSLPMRCAAAQLREYLIQKAATVLGAAIKEVTVSNGVASDFGGNVVSYGDLVGDDILDFPLRLDVALKRPEDYRIVGRSVPRLDIRAKVAGELTYVHDLRLPGMLHGRIVRPPYFGRDSGSIVGHSLLEVDRSSISGISGVVAVVVLGDFVGVVADREEQAIEAASKLKTVWRPIPALPDMEDLAETLRQNPAQVRPLLEIGAVDLALAQEPNMLKVSYLWPYQMHGSIGPSCGVADYQNGKLICWTGTQSPHILHHDLSILLDISPEDVRVVRMEASGCYGRNCADDASAEAALLARAVGRPVRVQLMRQEEHAWEPKGAAQLLEVQGGLTRKGTLVYDFISRYPSNNAPLLSLAQTGRLPSNPIIEHKGDRTVVPQYKLSDVRVVVRDMAPIVRAAWMRGVSALPNVFAHESFIDELATMHGEDPIAFRLRFMEDPRSIALTKAMAERYGWVPAPSPRNVLLRGGPRVLRGRGFAQHRYMHGSFPGVGAAWAAWACDVEVDIDTGVVRVVHVQVGYDCGLMVNPDGVRHQIHGNVVQSISRVLKEEVEFDDVGVSSLEWGAYPIIKFSELPTVDILTMPAGDNPPLGVGESGSVPSAAAIANAIFDALGVRLRRVPFTPARVRTAIQNLIG